MKDYGVMQMIVSLPYKILIERSVDKEIESMLDEMDLGKRCALICGERVQKILGFRIKEILSNLFKIEIISPMSVEKNYLIQLSKNLKSFDFVIGMGGGKNIDIAKYSSYLAKKPWIAFPTILSHDGVVSSRASINSKGDKISVNAAEPIAIICDLNTIRKAPYRRIAAGAGDLISNITAVEDWKIAAKAGKEKYHTLMAELSLLSAKGVINHADEIREKDFHGIEILLWSLICSGFAMNIYGSSRPCSGSEHNFSHALDVFGTNALHGEQCALGSIIMTYLQGKDWKRIRDIMVKIGLPTTSKEIGVDEKILIKALINAKTVRERYSILNEKNITTENAKEILRKTKIIP